MQKVRVLVIFLLFSQVVWGHTDINMPWHVHIHQNSSYRAFFGGFFATIFMVIGALVFYQYCIRAGRINYAFPRFSRKRVLPLAIPFTNSPSYVETPETIVLTTPAVGQQPSVFYSNTPRFSNSQWKTPANITVTHPFADYNAL